MPIDLEAVVISNHRLTSDYNVIALQAPQIASVVEPGQFVMIKAGNSFDPLLRRPYSVFEILGDDRAEPVGLSLLNKRIGPTTGLLFDAEPGERVRCLGPLGRPFLAVDPPKEAWMVAGGVGLAAFAILAYALRERGTPSTLFYGARHAADLHCLDLFDRLGCTLRLATEDGSRGTEGRITVPLSRALAERCAADVMVYACGPEPMLKAVSMLAANFDRPVQVSVERVMGCGLGGCYSCVVPTKTSEGGRHFVRSCLAGPVFWGRDLWWD